MDWILEFVTVGVFAAHLLAMNVAMGGPILCIWLERREAGAQRGASDDPAPASVEQRLVQWSLATFSLGLTLGVVLLGLVWLAKDAAYFAALAMIPRDRLVYGGLELAFYFAVMLGYQALARSQNRSRAKRWFGRVLAVAGASNLMAHFPTLFAMVSVLAHRPQWWGRTLDRVLYHRLLADGEVMSRVVHIWLAGLATAGVVVMAIAARRCGAGAADGTIDNERAADESALDARRVVAGGARWALAATLLQLPVGLWTLAAMPSGGEAAWSGDVAGWVLLGGGVLASLAMLESLVGAALGDFSSQGVHRVKILLAIGVLLMAGAAHRWRTAAETTPSAAPSSAPAASGEPPGEALDRSAVAPQSCVAGRNGARPDFAIYSSVGVNKRPRPSASRDSRHNLASRHSHRNS